MNREMDMAEVSDGKLSNFVFDNMTFWKDL